MAVAIRRGTDRFIERAPGRLTAHAFSFGASYDAEHVRFGPMVCHDDHLLRDGEGFPTHHHEDQVIVSWPLTGLLSHSGPGGDVEVAPGQVAVLRAGAGVSHAEVAAAPQTRFVQVWLTPRHAGGDPSYDVTTVDLPTGELVRVAEPEPGAVLSVVRLGDLQTVTIPAAPRVHVYVARGALLRTSLAQPMHEGDAFLFTDEPAHDLTAGVPSELLVWSFAG
jgi:redox-sensitive bicupin YhaK (pirin superfamily)